MSYLLPRATPGPLANFTASGNGEPPRTEHELAVFVRSLWRRKWLFLSVAGGFVALVAIITILMPKSYTTTVRLMAGNSGSGDGPGNTTALPILNALLMQSGVQTAETFAELAQQQNIADQVAQNLGLHASGGEILQRVTVKPVTNTAILDISVKWPNALESARIANEFAKIFSDTERQYVQSQASSALGFLNAELPHAERRMRDATNRLANFQSQNGLVEATGQTEQLVTREAQIQAKIQETTLDLQAAQALDKGLSSEMSGMSPTDNPVLGNLKTRLAQAESQLAIAREQYTEQHPAVIALKQQIDALRGQIAAEPQREQTGEAVVNPDSAYQALAQQETADRARVNADNANLVELRKLHDQMLQSMKSLPQKTMQLATLQQQAKLATDVYQALQQKHTDATIAQTTAISDVSVIQPAAADSAVVTPNIVRNLAIAPIVGVILAILVIFIVDYFDRKLRDASDVQKIIGLPVLASIPIMDTRNSRALPWLQSVTVEAFLHLCVSLRMSKRKLRSLAITSPSIGDGKSTVAFNLAKALSNLQPRVLLVDADLRRSVLHMHAERPNEIGLSDILSGEQALEDCVHEITPQFHLLSAGRSVENPIALLQSSSFDHFLSEATQDYAYTIVDSPALACVADGFAIASRVDGTALVISANTTDERLAKGVATQLQALGIDNLLGVVLNRDGQRFNDYSDYFASPLRQPLPKGAES